MRKSRNKLVNDTANKIMNNFEACKDVSQMNDMISEFVDAYHENGYSDYYASEDWCRVIRKVGGKANTAQTNLAEVRFWKERTASSLS